MSEWCRVQIADPDQTLVHGGLLAKTATHIMPDGSVVVEMHPPDRYWAWIKCDQLSNYHVYQRDVDAKMSRPSDSYFPATPFYIYAHFAIQPNFTVNILQDIYENGPELSVKYEDMQYVVTVYQFYDNGQWWGDHPSHEIVFPSTFEDEVVLKVNIESKGTVKLYKKDGTVLTKSFTPPYEERYYDYELLTTNDTLYEVHISDEERDDVYWDTQSAIYLNQDLIEAYQQLFLSSEGLDSYIQLRSSTVPSMDLKYTLVTNDANHTNTATDIKLLHEGVVWADNSYHEIDSDTPALLSNTSIAVDSTDHLLSSTQTEIYTSPMVVTDNSYHEHTVEALEAPVSHVSSEHDCYHVLRSSYSLWLETKSVTPIEVHNSSVRLTNTGYILLNGELFVNDAGHIVNSTEPAALTEKETSLVPKTGHFFMTSTEVGKCLIQYEVVPSDSHISLQSTSIYFPQILPQSCSHGTYSSIAWDWIERSTHGLTSRTNIRADIHDSYIRLATKSARLSPHIDINNTYHKLFTRDELVADNSYIKHIASNANGSSVYRRINYG